MLIKKAESFKLLVVLLNKLNIEDKKILKL